MYIKITSQWIIVLNIKPKTIKHLEGNIGKNLCDLRLGKDFLDISPKAEFIKPNQ